MEQMRRAMDHGALQQLPLVVLTGSDNPGMEAMREPWLDMQRDLARVSGAVTHHVLAGAGHIAMATEPEPIQKLITAGRGLVDSSRAGSVNV